MFVMTRKFSSKSNNVVLIKYVAQATAALEKAEAGFGEAPQLTAVDKRHTGKARKGAEKALRDIGNLAMQHQLESPSLQVADMVAYVDRVEALSPLQARLVRTTKRIDDEMFQAQAAAWDMGMQFYALLQRRALNDGDLAKNLEPVTKFFARGSRPTGDGSVREMRQKRSIERAVATLRKKAPNLLASQAASAPAPEARPAPAPATPPTPEVHA